MSNSQRMQETDLRVVGIYRLVGGDETSWETEDLERVNMSFQGMAGDRHEGTTRTVRGYESSTMRGNTVANDKQLSWVSAQDMIEIAEGLDLPIEQIEDRTLAPIYEFMAQNLGANILFLSQTRLDLNELMHPGLILGFGTPIVEKYSPALKTTEYNNACSKPINSIRRRLGEMGLSHDLPLEDFKTIFKNGVGKTRRGWIGSVYKEGSLILGSCVNLHEPVLPDSAT